MELLIKAIDATNPDPKIDACGCYKRGDVVYIAPDGHPWGKEERPPKFIVLKVPDLSDDIASELMEELYDNPDAEDRTILRRRKKGIDLSGITHMEIIDSTALKQRIVFKPVILQSQKTR